MFDLFLDRSSCREERTVMELSYGRSVTLLVFNLIHMFCRFDSVVGNLINLLLFQIFPEDSKAKQDQSSYPSNAMVVMVTEAAADGPAKSGITCRDFILEVRRAVASSIV